MASRIIGWIVVLGVIGGLVYYRLSQEEIVQVTTFTLEHGRVEQTATSRTSGTVTAQQDSLIASGTMATVEALHVKEGDRVTVGQVLVELAHSELDAQVELAKANLRVGQSKLEASRVAADIDANVAQINVEGARSQLAYAQKNYDRVLELQQKGGISKAELDQINEALTSASKVMESVLEVQRQRQVHAANIRSLESTLEQLEAAVTVAEAMRAKATIRAPFPGVVAKIIVDVGEAVASGMPLLQLVDDSRSYVKAPFDESYISQVKVGQKARLNIDAYRGVDFMGRVSYVSPVVSINPDLSRTLDVVIEIEDEAEKFVVGTSVDVMVLVREKEDVLFVPSEALVREEFAYVVSAGRAEKRAVTLGVGNWQSKEVLSGLSTGEELITSITLKNLHDGVLVEVVASLENK